MQTVSHSQRITLGTLENRPQGKTIGVEPRDKSETTTWSRVEMMSLWTKG